MADPTTICEYFPDIYTIPAGTDAQVNLINQKNDERAKLYDAVRFLLKQNFKLNGTVPEKPKDFGVKMPEGSDKIYFVGVYGLLLADNYTDPLMSKDPGLLGPDDIAPGSVSVDPADPSKLGPAYGIVSRFVQ